MGLVLAAYSAFVKSVIPDLGTLPHMPIFFVPLSACNGPPQGGDPGIFLIPVTYEVPD